MLDNWESFSSNLISDPFLDETGKFKDDLESVSTDFCESLDSLSNEPLSSKGSVTSPERIYSYSLEESDSLDDRATSSSTLNSIYDINTLDDNEVFAPDLSLFDETPRANEFSSWSPKAPATEASKSSNTFVSKAAEDQTALITATSTSGTPRIIRLKDKPNKMIQPVVIPSESKIVKMTVVSASTPVREAIKTAGIGTYSAQLKAIKTFERPKQLPTKFIVIKQPMVSYIPQKFTTVSNNFAQRRHPHAVPESDEEWEKDMPILTREAPFQPEQLSPPTTSKTPFQSFSKLTPIFECPKCQKKLLTKHSLAKHLHLHEPPRFKCSLCDKLFYDRSKLRRHQLIHSVEKRYECGICGNKFTLEHNLRIHLRIHQGLTPYYCAECNHGFTQLAHFRNHVHVHSQRVIKKIPNF